MKNYRVIVFLAIIVILASCKKKVADMPTDSTTNPHPFAGTVRLYETMRDSSLKYHFNSVTRGLYLTLGFEELIELVPGKNKDQYFIRPKDYPDWCIEYSTHNEFYIKLFPFTGSDAQLFTIKDKGSSRVEIQCTTDTTLYLLNNANQIGTSYSSYLKPTSYDLSAHNFWRIEKL